MGCIVTDSENGGREADPSGAGRLQRAEIMKERFRGPEFARAFPNVGYDPLGPTF